MKLPEFYSHNPQSSLLNAEAQFALANLTKEKTKFYPAVKVLDAKTSKETLPDRAVRKHREKLYTIYKPKGEACQSFWMTENIQDGRAPQHDCAE